MAFYKVRWDKPADNHTGCVEAVQVVQCREPMDFIKANMEGTKAIISRAVLPDDREGTMYLVQNLNTVRKFIFWETSAPNLNA